MSGSSRVNDKLLHQGGESDDASNITYEFFFSLFYRCGNDESFIGLP